MNYTALTTVDNKKITYEEFHEKVDKYAKYLYYEKGIRKEEKIGISLINSENGVYMLYALQKIGCQIIGLNPYNNETRMHKDILEVAPNRIITDNPLTNSFNISQIINPINDNELLKVNDKEDLINAYDPEKVTDIIFTGGSTGHRKGAMLKGNGINCVAQALDHVFVAKPGMTQLGNIPFGHMCFGRITLHYSLANNLNYALSTNFMPQNFLDEIKRTHAHAVTGGPIHWNSLAYNPHLKEGDLKQIIQATSGGEYYKPHEKELANEALKKGGSKTTIGDVLGMTEFWAPVSVNFGNRNTKGTIGYPIPYTDVLVVDKNFKEVEDGKVGSLLLSGPQMLEGYLNNEEETKKAFWYDDNNKKWYITGDVVRKTGKNNQELEYIGRTKRNFVCGIDNIYPEQIEKLLLEIPNIKEAVVTKIPDSKLQYLPIYHLSLQSMLIDFEQLKQQIEQVIITHVGESALPYDITYTDEPLKRTANAKIDIQKIEMDYQNKIKSKNESQTLTRKI